MIGSIRAGGRMKILAGDFKKDAVAALGHGITGRVKAIVMPLGIFSFERYEPGDVRSVEIVTQSNSTSIMAKAGWGTLGAVLLGPVGALAGILAAATAATWFSR
jgi:hypothetical protein